MKTFLIITGCIFIYVFMTSITLVLGLYCDRCNVGSSEVYEYVVSENFIASLFWPLSFWFVLGYLLYLRIRKHSIAMADNILRIAFDYKYPDDAALVVYSVLGETISIKKVFVGEEAVKIYSMLTGKPIEDIRDESVERSRK